MRRYALPLIIVGVLLVPTVASAVSWFPLVPCGVGNAPTCTPCDLFKTFKNVIDLVLYGITGPIAAFMIVWAGGLMLLGGANPTLYSQGTTMLRNTLIGVSIILMSWVVTNTLIKSLATGNSYDAWYEFSCPAFLSIPETQPLPPPRPQQGSAEQPAPELAQASAAACSPANLASANKVPNNTRLNSSSLTALITCIRQDPIVTAMLDTNQIFTFDNDYPLCNLTHGLRICSKCSHAVHSCHYGGRTGNQGAMAVDFNWNGKPVTYDVATRTVVANPKTQEPCKSSPADCRTVTGEYGLFDEIYRAAAINNCEYKLINYEAGSKGGHTHMSTPDCPGDGAGSGARGRTPPVLP